MSMFDDLPAFDAGHFPDLPTVQPTSIFLPRVAGWNLNREFAAGIIVTLCIQQERWMPLPQQDIIELICRCSRRSAAEAKAIFRELGRMNEERLVDVYRVGEFVYYYPTLALARRAVDVTHQHEDNFIWRMDNTVFNILMEMASQR